MIGRMMAGHAMPRHAVAQQAARTGRDTARRLATSLVAAALTLTICVATSGAQASLLITNATFLTMHPGEDRPFVGYMLVGDDGKIAAIGAGQPPIGLKATTTLDATNRIVIPGFVSAHSHAWQSALRGLGADEYVQRWGVAVRTYSVHATDEDLYWFTLHGVLDHLRHGITSHFNFGYSHRVGEYNNEQLRGLIDSGARFIHAFAQARTIPTADQYQSFLRYYAAAKAHLGNPRFLALGITGSGNTLDQARLDRRLMDEFGVVNQAHYLEYPRNVAEQQKLFENFIAAGTLGPNLSFGHFIHTTDDILKKTAAAGGGMSWQPLSNGRLGSGIPDIPKYLSMGVKVGMGVDGQASADVADPFENMRTGLYLLRARNQNAAVMKPIDVLRLHTLGSAEVMRSAALIGSLEVGKFADFNLLVPPSPVFDVAATVVFAMSSENLEAVYVGGEKLVDRLRPTRVDLAATNAEVDRRVARLRAVVEKR